MMSHLMWSRKARALSAICAIACCALGLPFPVGAEPIAMVVPTGLESRFLAPPGLAWGTFRNADDAVIRYCSVHPAGPARGTAILVTGFSEHAEKYFETMHDLVGMGLAVWVMDWRGQGGSDRYLAQRERGHSLGFARDIRDLDQFIRDIVRPPRNHATILVSHSMGGNISLRFLEERPGAVTAAVFSAPALSFGPERGWRRWLMRGVVWLGSHLGFATRYFGDGHDWTQAGESPEGLSHDRARGAVQGRWFQANPALRIGGPTYGWMEQFMASYEAATRPERLVRVETPALFGVPLADPVVNPGPELVACAAMRDCHAMPFEGAWHDLFMESEPIRSRWIAAIATFVDDVVKRGPGSGRDVPGHDP